MMFTQNTRSKVRYVSLPSKNINQLDLDSFKLVTQTFEILFETQKLDRVLFEILLVTQKLDRVLFEILFGIITVALFVM